MQEAEIRAAIREAVDCYQSGDFARAEEIYRQLVTEVPDAKKWSDLGAVLKAQGRHEDAIAAYRQAMALDPRDATPHFNLGNLLRDRGRQDEAVGSLRQAVALDPKFADAHINLGRLLLEKEELEEALLHMQKAAAASPASYSAHNNLGIALHRTGRIDEAIPSYERAIDLKPDSAEAFCNLAAAQLHLGRVDDAIASSRKAIELDPAFVDGHLHLGNCYRAQLKLDEAIDCYNHAMTLAPDRAGIHLDLSVALLLQGDYGRGWREYEWRWLVKSSKARRYDFAEWTGERAAGSRILLWGEQGIGDEIIYASMFAELKDAGMKVTLETDPRLVTLMQRSFPQMRVVARTDPPTIDPADFDWQCPLPSLGRWLRPTLASFPRHHGFLKPDGARVNALDTRLRHPGKLIGISWSSANCEFGIQKSSALADWQGILGVPGTRFVDLQYGDNRKAREALRDAGIEIVHLDDLDLYEDLEGVAALCAACDLIITTSNVTAHIAGALGRPVWTLVPIGRGRIWYWLAGRTDSPWYPSMRVFSQLQPGSWREPLAQIARQLASFVEKV